MGYVVTGALVIAKGSPDSNTDQEYFYQGSPLPEWVSKDQIDRFLADGLIAKSGKAAETELAADPEDTPEDLREATAKSGHRK